MVPVFGKFSAIQLVNQCSRTLACFFSPSCRAVNLKFFFQINAVSLEPPVWDFLFFPLDPVWMLQSIPLVQMFSLWLLLSTAETSSWVYLTLEVFSSKIFFFLQNFCLFTEVVFYHSHFLTNWFFQLLLVFLKKSHWSF